MLKSKTTPTDKAWDINIRPRIGDSVKHNTSIWTNVTGSNSEPGVGFDWELVVNQVIQTPITPLNVTKFEATHNQASYIVPEGAIVNDGLWTVQAGSVLLNSTTGITDFANGAISINFATGEITFNNPLQGGTQVIIKYN